MPKIGIKDKLLQVKISTDFYQRIVKYCQKYSASISAGTTSLIRRQLDVEEKKGIETEVTITEEIKNEIMKVKQSYDSVNDYIDRVLRDHFYRLHKSAEWREKNPYTDTKNDGNDNINQDEINANATKKFLNQFTKK